MMKGNNDGDNNDDDDEGKRQGRVVLFQVM